MRTCRDVLFGEATPCGACEQCRVSALEAQLAASEQARRETVKGIERASAMLYEYRHLRDPGAVMAQVCALLDELTIANAANNVDAVVKALMEGK